MTNFQVTSACTSLLRCNDKAQNVVKFVNVPVATLNAHHPIERLGTPFIRETKSEDVTEVYSQVPGDLSVRQLAPI